MYIYINYSIKIKIWVIDNEKKIPLLYGNWLFLRGDYKIYNKICNNFNKIIFYRAGILGARIDQPELRKYDKKVKIYFYDDNDEIHKKRYYNAVGLQFYKSVLSNNVFEFKGLQRKYDLLCVLKKTDKKNNYNLIIELINYIKCHNLNLKMIICGTSNKNYILNNIIDNKLPDDIILYENIAHEKLALFMNLSKYLLISAIYDGNPRIIAEANKCGTKVICSSKLKNGKKQILKTKGYVLDDKNINENIIKCTKIDYDHEHISKLSNIIIDDIIKNLTNIFTLK